MHFIVCLTTGSCRKLDPGPSINDSTNCEVPSLILLVKPDKSDAPENSDAWVKLTSHGIKVVLNDPEGMSGLLLNCVIWG